MTAKGFRRQAIKKIKTVNRNMTAIPATTVAMKIPSFAKVDTMSSTLITAPAIMKATPTGVVLESKSGRISYS